MLANALRTEWKESDPFYVHLDAEVTATQQGEDHVKINPLDRASIETALGCIDRLASKVVLLQHEFKLYGGPDGENISFLLRALKCPLVTTLHTVWPHFSATRHQIFMDVLQRSDKLLVFSKLAADILRENYGIGAEKVAVIPHGVPDVPFSERVTVDFSGIPAKTVKFITTGLLRPAKGIEHVLCALSKVKDRFSDFAYIICGADHPRNVDAKEYRRKLIATVLEYGLETHVFFIDRYLEGEELIRAIQACDCGILAYTASQQSSSGVLALTLSCGRPAIATDFQFAKAILGEDNGIVVPVGNIGALASAIEVLAFDNERRTRMRHSNYKLTRQWTWREVAKIHRDILKNEL